ncbi:MAG TPA: hypothetical protein VH081_07355 [Solirubrobacteraceae bacterium]|jgi:hypothetical protein|nr:hypothetical protein [Solirubrobacteraceae bacterium]
MTASRPRYGSLVSTIGAIVLVVAVFLPWYGVSFTAHGLALAQQAGEGFAAQFGNAALQERVASSHADLSALAGHEFLAVSAHQALSRINVVLLVLGGLACAVALVALADPSALADGGRSLLSLLASVAAACVVYRMVERPTPEGEVLSLSLREGAWLALLGCAAVLFGALLSARSARTPAEPSTAATNAAWAGLSGWTPEG